MVLVMNDHLSEQQIEQYAMGKLAVQDCGLVEEHLLVCESCQDALQKTDVFITHIRAVGKQIEQKPSNRGLWNRTPGFLGLVARPLPAFAASICAIGLIAIAVVPRAKAPESEPQQLSLVSHRGDGIGQPQAQANRALVLSLDADGLPDSLTYRLTIVGETGLEKLSSTASAGNGRLTLNVPAGLPDGTYFVRVYGVGKDLQREFAIVVK